MSPRPADPYAVLGLQRGATQAEVGRAYRALVRRHHPDTRDPQADIPVGTPGEPALGQIQDAYAVLGDPERRAEYDAHSATPARAADRAADRAAAPPRRPRAFLEDTGRAEQPPIQAGPVHWEPSRPRSSPPP